MFLAIINDTYSEVKSENVTSDIHIGSYIKAKWNRMVERLANVFPFLRKRRSKERKRRSEDDIADSSVEINNL